MGGFTNVVMVPAYVSQPHENVSYYLDNALAGSVWCAGGAHTLKIPQSLLRYQGLMNFPFFPLI